MKRRKKEKTRSMDMWKFGESNSDRRRMTTESERRAGSVIVINSEHCYHTMSSR